MGLFDFGDKSIIKELAYRIEIGIEQMESEIRKSPQSATPTLRGLAYAVNTERKKMTTIALSLSNSSLGGLKVKFKGEIIPYNIFLTRLIPISRKVKEMTGIDFLRGTAYINGAEHNIQ